MKLYFDNDIKTNLLKDKKICIIGYGNQGRAQALNIKESGFNVKVALRKNSKSLLDAKNDGFTVCNIDYGIKSSELICFLIPDENIKDLIQKKKNIFTKNQTLLFSHGYAVHFENLSLPKFLNIILVAPSGSGKMLRSAYKDGTGIPNLFAVNNDYSKNSRQLALEYSKAIGGGRVGICETTFAEEVETDLFGEQVILTGGLPMLIRKSFNVLVKEGYNPIVAWLVCYYEVKSIVDSFHDIGLLQLNSIISNIAEYGGYTSGKLVINDVTESNIKKILKNIKNGNFKKEWKKEVNSEFKITKNERQILSDEDLTKISKLMLNLTDKKNN
tara:strand:+ start:3932 stop:4918 length:987 start_codon:yes stop_codon:yes gene_type:complete